MGLFEKIFGSPEKQLKTSEAQSMFRTLTAYRPSFTTWNGMLYESELVRAAIDARARHIAKLKIELVGTAQPKLKNRLKHQPNDWQTWSQFLYRVSTILDCQGTCCLVPVMGGTYREVQGFFPVLPSRCELREYHGTIYLRYEFNNGQIAAVEWDKCAVLTRFQYKDDFFGSSNSALAETMQLIHIQNQGIEEAVKNSATYRFMAQLTNFTNDEDLVNERKAFSSYNFSAEAETGGLLLFPNNYKDIKQIDYQPYTVDDKQMQLIRTNVYNYFGVNEDVLQNKAFGDSWSAFYEGCVEHFAIQFSEVMSRTLFTLRERTEGNQIMLTANRLQYMSNNDKLQVSAQMLDRGIMSINEVREIWNLAPVDGGDVRIIRGEYWNANQKIEDESTEDNNGNQGQQRI